MNDPTLNPTPQFGTAEYAGPPGSQCQLCHQGIGATYYRLNDAMVCPSCVEKIKRERGKDTHAAFVRAITAGIGAAVAGMIGYALLTIILQGWVISIMALAVGWLVGTAMMKASGGVGGRRYQIAAVLLTYAAMSMAEIPIGIYLAGQHKPHQTEQQKLAAEQRQLEGESGQTQRQEPSPEPQQLAPSLGPLLARLIGLGLVSPFLDLQVNPFWGSIGLLILFWGMRMAWRISAGRPFQVLGPFDNSPPQR